MEIMVKARSLFNDLHQPTTIDVDLSVNEIIYKNNTYQVNDINWRVPINGTIYGAALNYDGELKDMGENLNEDPYKAPPKAPILYIKPVNTFSTCHAPVPLPSGDHELQAGAALGIVFKETATQVKAESALDYIEGFTVVNDISIPHESVHRPAIKQKARDGFCPVGPWIVNVGEVADPDNLRIKVYVNEELKQTNSTKNLVRNTKQLIEDITEFMTLYEGDVLLVGTPENPPRVKEGDTVKIEIENVGYLENKVVSENDVSKLKVKI